MISLRVSDLSDDEDFATEGSGFGSGDFSGDSGSFGIDNEDGEGSKEFALGDVNMVTWVSCVKT